MSLLYLGSSSQSRISLLTQSGISFVCVPHTADETLCDWTVSFDQVLLHIARYKMEHVVLPRAQEGDICYVLTADTMCQDSQGRIHGKPSDHQNARMMLRSLAPHGRVGTAFCVHKKKYMHGAWQTIDSIEKYVETLYELDVPEAWIDRYIAATPNYLSISGALTVEGFGAQFLTSIKGSYSSVIGLPLVEVRQALESLGFFNP